MKRLSLVLTFLTLPAFADDKPKPNTLTPKEIADGWILLFDGETTFGWKVDGDATVKEGELILGGKGATTATCKTTFLNYRMNIVVAVPGGRSSNSMTVERSTLDSDASFKTDSFTGLATAFPSDGAVALQVAEGKSARITSIKALPLKMTSLFNAKDLTGWKEFQATKDKKVASKFTVTKEGWLNVKNGPGDLQTEGQWADFVLQFECISNGKHLNSGMFFRCIPDLYQQGYEAQIRNEWMGDDRTKPVDFGTGAIYRRQAARKVVSTDGEWFTMTVAAHGRHIATWVNGYQVTDWTDDRKENDNARNGFKKGKGALSIQGHDPTTDLSFRNIRIQSLDPK
jgi:hypothetical protein